jgi:hypothetical protein
LLHKIPHQKEAPACPAENGKTGERFSQALPAYFIPKRVFAFWTSLSQKASKSICKSEAAFSAV